MRIIIAGGRTFDNYDLLRANCDKIIQELRLAGNKEFIIISGCACGADTLAIQYAKDKLFPIMKFPADWDKNGRGAGYIRNVEMADNADCLIAFWDRKSKGTKHMIDTATGRKLLVRVISI